MHTYIQRQNQQVNRRHIKITYLLTAPEPARGSAQLEHTFYHSPKLHPGPCSSVKRRQGTVTQTDRRP